MTMTAIKGTAPRDYLPALAVDNGWATNTVGPNYWGDFVTTAFNDFAGTVRMVFNRDGKLVGGYLAQRNGRNWHTEKVQQVTAWITGAQA